MYGATSNAGMMTLTESLEGAGSSASERDCSVIAASQRDPSREAPSLDPATGRRRPWMRGSRVVQTFFKHEPYAAVMSNAPRRPPCAVRRDKKFVATGR